MHIQYPSGRPLREPVDEPEIRSVLERVCNLAKIDVDDIHLQVIGARNEHKFKDRGLKLMSLGRSDRFSIPVLVGCKGDAIHGYLSYKPEGKAIAASSLFGRLQSTFGGKTLVFQENGHEKNGGQIATNVAPTDSENVAATDKSGEPDSNGVEDHPTQVPDVIPETTCKSAVPTVLCSDAAKLAPILPSYAGYFDDKSRLHTAVTALLVHYEVGETFSFARFAEVMDKEVGIKCPVKSMGSMIRTFIRLGYIDRENPDQEPSRYSMTNAAVDFAKTVVDQSSDVSSSRGQLITLPTESLTQQILRLKQEEEKFQSLFTEIEETEKILGELQLENLEDEIRTVRGEQISLRGRLAQLDQRLREIEALKVNAAQAKAKIADLQAKANDPALVASHRQFSELKQMMS